MANHGYISRDGRNLTFLTIYYGLKECYGLSSPLAFLLTFGGLLLIGRLPICLPFTVPALFTVRSRNKSGSQPGVIDLKLVGPHGCIDHNASLVHEDCPMGSMYSSTTIRHDWVGSLVGDVLPPVKRHVRDAGSDVSILHKQDLMNVKEEDKTFTSSILSWLEVNSKSSSSSSRQTESTVVADDEHEDS
ncbi:hypothetical protein AAF712_016514 [Marasmius tenuissimus]|uniref:Heme haloperoxidase family profile domain-containing protein n=1 Tax=Marasmius tenuissimus TaxID=585030 RepID=A0ABR2Z5J4_9AGAR